MGEIGAGTNGGEDVTTGEALRRRRLLWLALGLAGFLTIQSIANVESTLEDMAKLGVIESRAHVWTWQLTSLVVWLALRFSGVLVRILKPSGIEVLTRIAGLLLAAIAVQLMADAIGAFVEKYTTTHP